MTAEPSRNRLGRGLAALIGEFEQPTDSGTEQIEVHADMSVSIELIRANPNNPRRKFAASELEDLANSIAEHGVVQPILVRPVADDGGSKYEIIAGERRWRAAQKAGLHEIPVLLREVADREALEIAIIENVQRADLNALEEAQGYRQLMDEYSYTQAELSKVVAKSRSHVANTMRLLNLPDEVQALVSDGELSAGHARALITCSDPAALARKIVADGLSVRQTETLAKAPSAKASDRGASPARNPDLVALEQRLGDALGMKVAIAFKPDGSGDGGGNVRIRYGSLEQLDEVCRRIEGAAAPAGRPKVSVP